MLFLIVLVYQPHTSKFITEIWTNSRRISFKLREVNFKVEITKIIRILCRNLFTVLFKDTFCPNNQEKSAKVPDISLVLGHLFEWWNKLWSFQKVTETKGIAL